MSSITHAHTTRHTRHQSTAPTNPLHALPFVNRFAPGGVDFWHVPDCDDYGAACDLGCEYAAHFIAHLKDHPYDCHVLGWIVEAMDTSDDSPSKGVRVGFLSYLARFLVVGARHSDVFADLAAMRAWYVEIWQRFRLAFAAMPASITGSPVTRASRCCWAASRPCWRRCNRRLVI